MGGGVIYYEIKFLTSDVIRVYAKKRIISWN